MTAMEIDPIHRPFGEGNLVSDEAGEGNARNHGVLETLAERRARAVEIPAGASLLERSGLNRNTVEFSGCPRRIARDFERLGRRKFRQEERNNGKQ